MSDTLTIPSIERTADPELESVVGWQEVLRATLACRNTIKNWVRDGRFPAPLPGPWREWRWSRSDLRAYFAGLKVKK
jgi:predicted DNA-binding transcriptional regulator AlpA